MSTALEAITLGVSFFTIFVCIATLVMVVFLFLGFRRYASQNPRLHKDCICRTPTVVTNMSQIELGTKTADESTRMESSRTSERKSKKERKETKEAKEMRLVKKEISSSDIVDQNNDFSEAKSLEDVRDWVKKKLEEMKAVVEIQERPGHAVLTGTLGKFPSKKTVLFYTEIGEKDLDNKLNRKGALVSALTAVKIANEGLARIPMNIKFLIEISSDPGLVTYARQSSRERPFFDNVDVVIVLNSLCNSPSLLKGSLGMCFFDLCVTCAKQDLHSGVFGGAIPEAMTDLTWLMSEVSDAKKGALGKGVSTSLHGINGAFYDRGDKTVIPAKVVGKVSVRFQSPMASIEVSKRMDTFVEELCAKRKTPNILEINCTKIIESVLVDEENKCAMLARLILGIEIHESVPIVEAESAIPAASYLSTVSNHNFVILNLGTKKKCQKNLIAAANSIFSLIVQLPSSL